MARSITLSKGSTAWGSELNAYKLELIVTEISTNGNASEISYLFQLHSGSNAFTTWTTERAVKLNGKQVAYAKNQVSLGKNATLVYFQGSATVEHNEDGTLTMPIEAYIEMTPDYTNDFTPSDERVTLTGSLELTPIEVTTACSEPTVFEATPAPVFEETLVFRWSGSVDGKNNKVQKHEIQGRYSSDGNTWSSWTHLWAHTNEGGVTLTRSGMENAGLKMDRGNYFQFRIRAQGEAGEKYYSRWNTMPITFRRNSVPSAPTGGKIDKSQYSPGNAICASWKAADDADGNVAAYRVFFAVSDSEEMPDAYELLDEVAADGDGEYRFTPDQAGYRQYLHLYLQAVDSFGLTSDEAYVGAVWRNDDPKVTINGRTYLVTIGKKKYMPVVLKNGKLQRLGKG